MLGELEDPRRCDQRDADDVVERRVELGRDEAHVKLLRGDHRMGRASFARRPASVRRTYDRRVSDVLIFADTARPPELRHEP